MAEIIIIFSLIIVIIMIFIFDKSLDNITTTHDEVSKSLKKIDVNLKIIQDELDSASKNINDYLNETRNNI